MAGFPFKTTRQEIVVALSAEATGKTILITGPSEQGFGAQTALDLADGNPKLIILAGRNRAKIQPGIDEINNSYPNVNTSFLEIDLADRVSVRQAAKKISSQMDELDILINNAGVMSVELYTVTKDGIGTHFGANHIGHFIVDKSLDGQDIGCRERSKNPQLV